MNEFTKQELKDILWFLVAPKAITPGNTLVPKLQDMIGNYCEPKSSCCSIHAGSGEECVDSVSNNSPKVDWSKAKINEDFRNVSYKFEVKQPEECGHEWTAVFTPLPFPVTKIKCKLCGEFYK